MALSRYFVSLSKCKPYAVISCQVRSQSDSSVVRRDSNQQKQVYSQGTGGRSSVSGNVVTVFGASGMLGRILINRLGKEGSTIVVPYRGDVWDLRHLKLAADLGNMYFQEIDIRNPDSIRKAVKHSNVVINCIGSDYETSNFSFNDVNVTAARNIARASQEAGVNKLIHFSALNASLNPQQIYFKPSQYLITKYLGEQAVRQEFENAVVIRPSNVYGENDRFLFYYVNELRRGYNSIPLWKKGEMTIKMPVHQSDVADGVMKILHNKDIKGTTFDFVGPRKYLLSEIVDYIFQNLQRDIKRTYMTPTRLAITFATEKVLKRSFMNMDILEREFISDALSTDVSSQTLQDIGIKQKDFEEAVTWHLKVFNKLSYYNERLGEFPEPKPPKPLSDDFEYQLRRKIKLSA